MKTYQDFLKDLLENEELREVAKKALGSDQLKITEDQYAAVVAFGKEHGYDFTEEDIHMNRAANRTMDDSELALVSGGGIADVACSCDHGRCDRNWGCYNDYLCSTNQLTEWGGKGKCAFDYSCSASWNSCAYSDKCSRLSKCNGTLY